MCCRQLEPETNQRSPLAEFCAEVQDTRRKLVQMLNISRLHDRVKNRMFRSQLLGPVF